MRATSGAVELLTRDGGPVRTSEALRDKVALYGDGRCLISRAHADDVDVISLIALARRLGYATQPPEFVDLGSLRSCYSSVSSLGSWAAAARSVHDDTAMQREVQGLLRRAAAVQASDIHIVVDAEAATLRLRVDGELQPMPGGAGGTVQWRADHGRQICLTAYAMAAEGGTADSNYDPFSYQAGRIMTGLPPGVQAVRLQFNPVGYSGRHLAMRLLYSGHAAGRNVGDLGFSPAQVEALAGFTENKSGMVVISGPTGSGKTTTLERLMRRIVEQNPGDCVLSVEDPPEYRIPGVIQLPVSNMRNDAERDGAYTEAIAAALRSDPDRIMIGEIRTRAAAHHAFEAAMTGHQVLTTVHANDALGCVSRLKDIGVEGYKLRDASLLCGLVAQRLVRRLCPCCRRQTDRRDAALPPGLAERLEALVGERPVWLPGSGCDGCRCGYAGRTVVAEFIRPDQALLDLLVSGEHRAAARHWREVLGGRSLLDHAVEKIAAGVIDPAQAESRLGRLVPP